MRAHIIEVAAAALAAAFGAISVAVTLFAPTVSTMSATAPAVSVASDGSIITAGPGVVTSETVSLYEDGVESALIVALVAVALMLAWLVAAAYLHGRAGVFVTSAPVWAPALLLCAFVFVTGFSIGLFFFPSALFALIAAIAATRTAHNLRA